MYLTKNNVKKELKKSILFNLTILLIFISWSLHSVMNTLIILPIIDILLFSLAIFISALAFRKNVEFFDKMINFIFSMILIFYLIDVCFFNDKLLFPLIISYSQLIGLNYHHNIILFLILLGLIILKILPIKLNYVKKKGLINLNIKGGIFEFFMEENRFQKFLILAISLPLAAFVEEFMYRSVFLSIFTLYFKWNLLLSALIISIGFGLVHLSASRNILHVISASISSLIYFIALIELGLMYAWILHLTTNITAMIFFYPEIKKIARRDRINSTKSMVP